MLSIKTRVSRKPRKANPVKNTFSDRFYTLDMNVLLVTWSQIKLQKETKISPLELMKVLPVTQSQIELQKVTKILLLLLINVLPVNRSQIKLPKGTKILPLEL